MKDSMLERNDIGVLQVLLRDSRASEQQIAEVVNIAPRGVEVRTENMIKEGVVRSMTTKPSLSSLGATSVLVYGKCRLRSVEQAIAQLGGNESIAWIAHSTGGRFYVAIHLKKGEDVGSAVSAVERDAMMLRPAAAVRDLFDLTGTYRYSALDWRIIYSLRDDPRKDMHDVAIELGVAKAKVEERFERMLGNAVLDFSIDFDTNSISNMLCMFHIESLHPDGTDAVEEIMTKHSPNILFFNTYSNMRHMLTATALVDDFEEVKAIMRSLQEREEFAYIEADPIISSALLRTWRDKLIMKKGNPPLRR
ncbi:MAG: winged helix-turn-helix transcriptional regulator [Methanomassiliicoccales archaeon]|jgi:DNA-binding Lrp family transcriptional regulator